MNTLPLSPYAPDMDPDQVGGILNVYPRSDGYGPTPTSVAYSAALPAACRGYFYARNADATITVFAATSTRIFKLNNSDFTWVPVSKVTALTSISNATPAVLTLNSHGLSVGDAIVLSTSGGLPTGLVVGTVYYVISAGFTANAFEVSLTLGGTAVNTSSAGSGTHSFTAQYSALPGADQWQFAQFNNFVFAVQINSAVQVYDLTTSTAFADLAGSPPQARYIAVVGRFLVLSGLGSSTPYRIQWSGLNATTTWTSGVNSSDFQDLPDGGPVRGVAGGEYGLIMQDNTIRQMTYVGSTLVFQIQRISQDRGIYAPLSLCQAGERVFYLGVDGFKMYIPGGYPVSIGKEKIDKTFFADVDGSALQLCIGASDPSGTRVLFAYKSLAGTTNFFDKVLIYDYALNMWAPVSAWVGEAIATLAKPGLTLENLDSISLSIDALIPSLDSFATAATVALSMFDSSHKLAFLNGPNAAALVETDESWQDDNSRIRVKWMRPITDATTVTCSVGARETAQDNVTYSTAQAVGTNGRCPANISTRMARGRMTISAGSTWSFLKGIDPFVKLEGKW